jgi:hypothetical protein
MEICEALERAINCLIALKCHKKHLMGDDEYDQMVSALIEFQQRSSYRYEIAVPQCHCEQCSNPYQPNKE